MAYKNIEITGTSSPVAQASMKTQVYKGFSSVDPKNFNTRLYDFELIKQDIINHFKTKKGERLMNPGFGSIIWDLLMEPLTDQVRDALSEDITKICNFDPRVIPTQIDLKEFPNGYILELTLLLKGTDQSINLSLTFDQQIGLTVQ